MNILVTGSSGFIGQHLCEALEQTRDCQLLKVNSKTSEKELEEYLQNVEFVYHLAATHRPKDIEDFQRINVDYFGRILKGLEKYAINCPVVFISSIHVGNGSNYGNSKLEGEKKLLSYGQKTGARTHILRLTNTFGKYAKINHTSVVANFCYNISHNIPIVINSNNAIVNLCYIDDVITELVSYLMFDQSTIKYINKNKIFSTTVGELASDIYKMSLCDEDSIQDSIYYKYLFETYKWYKNQK